MAGKLIFDMSAVRGLMAASLAAAERRPTFAQLYEPEIRRDGKEPGDDDPFPTHADVDPAKIPPGLMLVKDHGVYLMSNAALPEGEKPTVVYAEGLNPEVDDFDDWWHTASDICGGDDFVEALPLKYLPTDNAAATKLVVGMAADSITFGMR